MESLSKTKVKTSKHLCSITRSTLNNELKSQTKPEVNFTLFRLGDGGGGGGAFDATQGINAYYSRTIASSVATS